MVFNNAYNQMIAQKLNATARKHIAMEKAMNENPAAFVEPTPNKSSYPRWNILRSSGEAETLRQPPSI